MPISFNAVPVDARTPATFIEFDASRAGGEQGQENRILLVGQMLATGTADPLTIQPVYTSADGAALFGRGSMLDRMVRTARSIDRLAPCHVIALEDLEAGVKASGTLTVTGPASAAGTIRLMIGGQRVPVVVAAGTIATAIATAIAATVNAADDLPVTASVNAAVVTLTALHKGTSGNDIDVRINHELAEALPAGVAIAIAAMANGAGNPDWSDIWAVIGDGYYRTIILGHIDGDVLGDMTPELLDRWGPVRMQDAMAYGADVGTVEALTTFAASHNNQLVSVIDAGGSPSLPCEIAAAYGVTAGYYSFIDPARPLHRLPLRGVVPPREGGARILSEREELLRGGIATHFTVAGTVQIERAITMYQENSSGVEDEAYLDSETLHTLAYLRGSLRARFLTKFPRHKLANDDTRFGPGQAIITPKIAKAEVLALAAEDWEPKGLVEDMAKFKADLIVERDADNPNRLNMLLPPNLVNQLRQLGVSVQFRL